eukprot:2993931-Rhodomonas_salina.1
MNSDVSDSGGGVGGCNAKSKTKQPQSLYKVYWKDGCSCSISGDQRQATGTKRTEKVAVRISFRDFSKLMAQKRAGNLAARHKV